MRLIDADQFKAKLLSFMNRKAPTPSDTDCILDGVLNLLEKQPTKTHVKHGHWIHDITSRKIEYYRCSICNHGIHMWWGWQASLESPAEEYRYCPSCGAKMSGDIGGDRRE